MTNIVRPFYTNKEEDFKHSPVWHDNDQCSEGNKILPGDKNLGIKGNKCESCIKLDAEGVVSRIVNRRK
jgi:hypothetical protein